MKTGLDADNVIPFPGFTHTGKGGTIFFAGRIFDETMDFINFKNTLSPRHAERVSAWLIKTEAYVFKRGNAA